MWVSRNVVGTWRREVCLLFSENVSHCRESCWKMTSDCSDLASDARGNASSVSAVPWMAFVNCSSGRDDKDPEIMTGLLIASLLRSAFLLISANESLRGTVCFSKDQKRDCTNSWQTFSVKGLILTIWGFVGQMASVATAGVCPGGVKAATDHRRTNEHGRLPIKLYLQKWA